MKDQPLRTFSIYSLRLPHVARLGKNSATKASPKSSHLDSQDDQDNKAAEGGNMAQSKRSKVQGTSGGGLGYGHSPRLSESLGGGKIKSTKKAGPTTLKTLGGSISELLKICFIPPFTGTGGAPVAPNSWDGAPQLKWGLLGGIFDKYHWRGTPLGLPAPPSPSTQGVGRALAFKGAPGNPNLPRGADKIFISLALGGHHGDCTGAAVVGKNGVLRLHSLLDLAQKGQFWGGFKNNPGIFPAGGQTRGFVLIVPNKMLLGGIPPTPKSAGVVYDFVGLVPGGGIDGGRNEAFPRSIHVIKKDHKCFQYLDLGGIGAAELARLQYYRVRGTKLSPGEFAFIGGPNTCPRRKGHILSAT